MYRKPRYHIWLHFQDNTYRGGVNWFMIFEDPNGERKLYGWTASNRERATLQALCVALELAGKRIYIYAHGCNPETIPLISNFKKHSLCETHPTYFLYRKDLDLWTAYRWRKAGNRVKIIKDGSRPSFAGMKAISANKLYTVFPRWLRY